MTVQSSTMILDGDFVGHNFRGNQHVSASRESSTAVKASQRAKHAEKHGDQKAKKKAHKSAHFTHMAAAEEATTATTRKYHQTMAKFHGSRSDKHLLDSAMEQAAPLLAGVVLDSTATVSHAVTQLQVALDTATTNEPISRARGDIAQAELQRDSADDFRDAIEVLKARDGAALVNPIMDDAEGSSYGFGAITKDGVLAGRAYIGGDGKAMVFTGSAGQDRVTYVSPVDGQRRAVGWSDDDAADMVGYLLTPAVTAETAGAGKFRYGLVNRPADMGAVPKGNFTLEDAPAEHKDYARHGIIVYDRRLSIEEIRQFELAVIIDGADARKGVAESFVASIGEYAPRYADMARSGRDVIGLLTSNYKKWTLGQYGGPVSVGPWATFSQLIVAALLEANPAAAASPLPEGWTESRPGGMATNRDPIVGGIVDVETESGEWFVIFNNDAITKLDGFDSRAEAFEAMAAALAKAEEPVEPAALAANQFYNSGDLAEYTGQTEIVAGALFYQAKYLEGAKMGQTFVTARAPDGTNPLQAGPTPGTGIVTPQITPSTVDPVTQADRAYLQSLIDGTADMFAPDVFDRLEPLFTKYEADAAMMVMVNDAAEAYSKAAVKAAMEALAA